MEKQAIDRAHRIGQTRPVYGTRFCMQDSVEKCVIDIQEAKRHLVEQAVGSGHLDDKQLNTLLEEDTRALLKMHRLRDF